ECVARVESDGALRGMAAPAGGIRVVCRRAGRRRQRMVVDVLGILKRLACRFGCHAATQ
ncbi:hypothetical protein IAI13_33105, partial [Escherichia coli]|nr:hypothetical protein [Escherichia coli]